MRIGGHGRLPCDQNQRPQTGCGDCSGYNAFNVFVYRRFNFQFGFRLQNFLEMQIRSQTRLDRTPRDRQYLFLITVTSL